MPSLPASDIRRLAAVTRAYEQGLLDPAAARPASARGSIDLRHALLLQSLANVPATAAAVLLAPDDRQIHRVRVTSLPAEDPRQVKLTWGGRSITVPENATAAEVLQQWVAAGVPVDALAVIGPGSVIDGHAWSMPHWLIAFDVSRIANAGAAIVADDTIPNRANTQIRRRNRWPVSLAISVTADHHLDETLQAGSEIAVQFEAGRRWTLLTKECWD